jgi:hypothetical protein
MKTKALVRFLNRAAHFDADIELVDVLHYANLDGALHSSSVQYLFKYVRPDKHPRLANRATSDHSRLLAITHLKATLCASFIKDIYEDLYSYLREILTAAAENGLDPNRLIGEHKLTLEGNDLLRAGTWQSVVQLVADDLFRKLENLQNTKTLIEKINDKLNLRVDRAKIDAALPYLEIRHLLVHNDGLADDRFCNQFSSFGATVGERLSLDYEILNGARTTIVALVNEYDAKVVANSVVPKSFLQP